MTITEFLNARLDEDEAVARESVIDASRWSVFAVDKYFGQVDSDDGAVASSVDLKDAEHIARWDPARVIAEIETKRRIVEMTPVVRGLDNPLTESWHMLVLGHLASVYADHEDYFMGWKP